MVPSLSRSVVLNLACNKAYSCLRGRSGDCGDEANQRHPPPHQVPVEEGPQPALPVCEWLPWRHRLAIAKGGPQAVGEALVNAGRAVGIIKPAIIHLLNAAYTALVVLSKLHMGLAAVKAVLRCEYHPHGLHSTALLNGTSCRVSTTGAARWDQQPSHAAAAALLNGALQPSRQS